MGLFKKIFKPVRKVLDKVIPNEIKPALPFAAAFLPMIPGFGGAATGLGKALGFSKYASGIGGGILGAGANIFSQLAQEGNEEADINLLSAGLGALASGLAAQGPAAFSNKLAGTADYFPPTTAAGKLKEFGLAGLEKGAKFLQPLTEPGFNLATAKAATVPLSIATGDVMEAQQRQIDKQAAIDAALAEAEALADSGARADAIRNAMRAYGFFTDEEIEETISSAGYKKGGRVGFDNGGEVSFGGITEAVKKIEEKPKEFLVDKLKVTMKPGQSEMRAIIEAMYNDVDGVMPDDRKKEFYELYAPQMYRNGDMDRAEFEFIQTEILGKDMNQPIAKKDGGLMDLGGKEMDLRGGGFVPIGKKERADDVPARLSKNEFVMTADAVRAAGGGSVNEGAKRMYKVMNDLEARA